MVQRKQIQSLSLIGLLCIMLILMGKLMLPYMTVILWAAIMYILISPIYSNIIKKLNHSSKSYEFLRHLLAGFFALGTVLILASILIFLGFQISGQLKAFLDGVKNWVKENPDFFKTNLWGAKISQAVHDLSMGTIDISEINLKEQLLSLVAKYSSTIVNLTTSILKNVSHFIVSLAFVCFALYFFYLDASYLGGILIHAFPIDAKSTIKLMAKFKDVTKNLFMGFFLVAFYQSVAAFIIFWIFKIQGSLLFAFLILFSSFVPMVGCALVWAPLGISVIVSKGLVTGLIFIFLCAFFISFLDNFLRPFFLKDRIKIHPLLIFFSILGGLEIFGLNGIVLGPLIIILFFTIIDIALEVETQGSVSDLNVVSDLEPKEK